MATLEDKMLTGVVSNTDCSWCHTSQRESKFSFLWTIEDFSCLQKDTGEFIESSTFSSKDDDSNKFCLRLFPEGENDDKEDFVSLFLRLPVGNFPVMVHYVLWVVNNKKEKCLERSGLNKFESKDSSWGRGRFVRIDHLNSEANGFIENDKLTILCEIVVKGVGHVMKNGCFNLTGDLPPKNSKSHLTEDFGRLLETKNFSDVVLVTKDDEVHCHKAILTVRSPVFAAMFMNDMAEKQTNRVKIVDIDHEVLQEMIRFIYTGRTPDMDDNMATQLLEAAEKYALEGLKESCEVSLSMNLTPEKVIDLIPLASLYDANHIKASLINYLKLHAKDDAVDHLWNYLISHLPRQAVDVCCKSLDPKKIES